MSTIKSCAAWVLFAILAVLICAADWFDRSGDEEGREG